MQDNWSFLSKIVPKTTLVIQVAKCNSRKELPAPKELFRRKGGAFRNSRQVWCKNL